MKEYEFVRVELSTMRRRPKEDYQQIIHDYAKRGWRFVQIFAPSIDGYGAAAILKSYLKGCGKSLIDMTKLFRSLYLHLYNFCKCGIT